MEKTKTIVSIGGKDYTICGTESAEYIHRVALKVNGKLDELKRSHPELNNIQLAMLTSINLADDYVKLFDDYEILKKETERLQAELERMAAKLQSGQNNAPNDETTQNKQGNSASDGTLKFPPRRP